MIQTNIASTEQLDRPSCHSHQRTKYKKNPFHRNATWFPVRVSPPQSPFDSRCYTWVLHHQITWLVSVNWHPVRWPHPPTWLPNTSPFPFSALNSHRCSWHPWIRKLPTTRRIPELFVEFIFMVRRHWQIDRRGPLTRIFKYKYKYTRSLTSFSHLSWNHQNRTFLCTSSLQWQTPWNHGMKQKQAIQSVSLPSRLLISLHYSMPLTVHHTLQGCTTWMYRSWRHSTEPHSSSFVLFYAHTVCFGFPLMYLRLADNEITLPRFDPIHTPELTQASFVGGWVPSPGGFV